MQQLEIYHIAFLALAIVLEIVANVFLKLSNGFKRMGMGLLSSSVYWVPLALWLRR